MEYILNRININPNKYNNSPIIRNTRITVQTIFDFLSTGENKQDIPCQYLQLEADVISTIPKFEGKLIICNYFRGIAA